MICFLFLILIKAFWSENLFNYILYGTLVFFIVTLTKIALEINKNVLMMSFEAMFDYFFSLEFTILKIFFSKKSAVCDEGASWNES